MKNEIISIDTETVSLSDKILLCFSISYIDKGGQQKTYVYPIKMNTTINEEREKMLPFLIHLIKNNKIIFHNSSFDVIVLIKYGIPQELFQDIDDTVIISHLLDENIRHGLKSLVKRYFHYSMFEYKEVCGTGKKQISFADVDWEIAKKYSEQDAEFTLKLYNYLYPKLQQEGKLLKIYETIERPLLSVVIDMQKNGININTDKVKEISDLCKENIDSIEERLTIFLGEDFNINSSKQLKEYFIDKLGKEILKKSKITNEPSVDKEVLEKYAEKDPVAKLILEYRKYKKIYSTFIPALTPDDWDLKTKTGKIYASFNQAGTVSGRFSSSSPNMQNIPREKDEYGIRETIIADKEQILVGADYSQIELRVLAHVSQDSNLLKAYQEGKDIHKMTADACGITRDEAKRINFGLAYGAGINTISKIIEKPYEESQKYVEKYFETYPKIKDFWDNAKKCIKEKGFVETITGRKRRRSKEFFDLDSYEQEGEMRSMINHIIQGSASDVIKLAMVLIYPELENLNSRIVLTVHDELVISCPSKNKEKIMKILESNMKKAWNNLGFSVPIDVSIKSGDNWDETH